MHGRRWLAWRLFTDPAEPILSFKIDVKNDVGIAVIAPEIRVAKRFFLLAALVCQGVSTVVRHYASPPLGMSVSLRASHVEASF